MIYERLKVLYENGIIKDLTNYIAKGLITEDQANSIMGITYEATLEED